MHKRRPKPETCGAYYPCHACGSLAMLRFDGLPDIPFCSWRCYLAVVNRIAPASFQGTTLTPLHKENPVAENAPKPFIAELHELAEVADRIALADIEKPDSTILRNVQAAIREAAKQGKREWLLSSLSSHDSRVVRRAIAERLRRLGLETMSGGGDDYLVSWRNK